VVPVALLKMPVRCASTAFSIRGMSSRLLALTFEAHDPDRLAGFWAGVLGRVVVDDRRGALLPGSDTQVGLRFAPGAAEKVGQNGCTSI